MAKILVADKMEKHFAVSFAEQGHEVIWAENVKPEELPQLMKGIDIIVARSKKILPATIEAGRGSLKAIIRAGSGVADIYNESTKALLAELGVTVSNTPGANANATAQGALVQLAKLLGVEGKETAPIDGLSTMQHMIWARNFDAASADATQALATPDGKTKESKNKYRGDEVTIPGDFGKNNPFTGKKILVIGSTGKVGSIVSGDLSRAGATVVGFHSKSGPLAEIIGRERPDIIMVHAEQNAKTKGMLGEKEFAVMKRGTLIVNNARPGLIDVAALKQAAESGIVAGVALDAEVEKLRPYAGIKGLLVTPHTGSETHQAQMNTAMMTDKAIRTYSENGIMPHIVNAEDIATQNLPKGMTLSQAKQVVANRIVAIPGMDDPTQAAESLMAFDPFTFAAFAGGVSCIQTRHALGVRGT